MDNIQAKVYVLRQAAICINQLPQECWFITNDNEYDQLLLLEVNTLVKKLNTQADKLELQLQDKI